MDIMRSVMAQEQIERLKLELEEANNALRLKEVQLASKTSIIKNLEQSAETFKKQLKKLEDKDKEASKGTPQTPSYDFDAQLNSYRQEIKIKDGMLSEAKANVSTYSQNLSKMTDQVNNLKLRLEDAENTIEEKDIQILKLNQWLRLQNTENTIDEKDIQIQRLKQANADLQRAAKNSADLQKAARESADIQKAARESADLQKAARESADIQKAARESADIQKAAKDTVLSASLAEIQSSQQVKFCQSFNPQIESMDEDELQFLNPHKKMVKQVEGYCKEITNLRDQIRFLNILSAFAENKLDDISETIFNDQSNDQ